MAGPSGVGGPPPPDGFHLRRVESEGAAGASGVGDADPLGGTDATRAHRTGGPFLDHITNETDDGHLFLPDPQPADMSVYIRDLLDQACEARGLDRDKVKVDAQFERKAPPDDGIAKIDRYKGVDYFAFEINITITHDGPPEQAEGFSFNYYTNQTASVHDAQHMENRMSAEMNAQSYMDALLYKVNEDNPAHQDLVLRRSPLEPDSVKNLVKGKDFKAFETSSYARVAVRNLRDRIKQSEAALTQGRTAHEEATAEVDLYHPLTNLLGRLGDLSPDASPADTQALRADTYAFMESIGLERPEEPNVDALRAHVTGAFPDGAGPVDPGTRERLVSTVNGEAVSVGLQPIPDNAEVSRDLITAKLTEIEARLNSPERTGELLTELEQKQDAATAKLAQAERQISTEAAALDGFKSVRNSFIGEYPRLSATGRLFERLVGMRLPTDVKMKKAWFFKDANIQKLYAFRDAIENAEEGAPVEHEESDEIRAARERLRNEGLGIDIDTERNELLAVISRTGLDPAAVVESMRGQVLERLESRNRNLEEYEALFREHPGLAERAPYRETMDHFERRIAQLDRVLINLERDLNPRTDEQPDAPASNDRIARVQRRMDEIRAERDNLEEVRNEFLDDMPLVDDRAIAREQELFQEIHAAERAIENGTRHLETIHQRFTKYSKKYDPRASRRASFERDALSSRWPDAAEQIKAGRDDFMQQLKQARAGGDPSIRRKTMIKSLDDTVQRLQELDAETPDLDPDHPTASLEALHEARQLRLFLHYHYAHVPPAGQPAPTRDTEALDADLARVNALIGRLEPLAEAAPAEGAIFGEVTTPDVDDAPVRPAPPLPPASDDSSSASSSS